MNTRIIIDFSYSNLVHWFFFIKLRKTPDFIVIISFFHRNFILRIDFILNTQFEIDRLISLITKLASSYSIF
jgi:hypothetical protein